MRQSEKPKGNRYIKDHFALYSLPTDKAKNEDNNTKDEIDESNGVPSEMHRNLLLMVENKALQIELCTR